MDNMLDNPLWPCPECDGADADECECQQCTGCWAHEDDCHCNEED